MDWKFERVSEKPTEKQVNYAKAISKTLGIDLPKDFTKEDYSYFISKNENKMKRARQSYNPDYWETEEDFDWYNEFMNG